MSVRLQIAVLLAAVVVSLLGGVYVGTRIAAAQHFAGEFYAIARESALLDLARVQSTPEGYEEALKRYLAFLEAFRGSRSPLFDERAYSIDSALAYARLANLAESTGAMSRVASYEERAESYCPMIKFKVCSASKLRELANRLDENSLMKREAAE